GHIRSCDVGAPRRIFFLASRRRHTISYGDWSSDVCSSDLADGGEVVEVPQVVEAGLIGDLPDRPQLLDADPLARRLEAEAKRMRSEERRVGKERRGGGGRER